MKTIKAVSVLVPLFGLQYLVVAFTPEAHSLHKIVIEFVKAVITSFQGLVVSLLFCFFNNKHIDILRTEEEEINVQVVEDLEVIQE